MRICACRRSETSTLRVSARVMTPITRAPSHRATSSSATMSAI
ncbi:hypothetical protein [Synechococcus sp. RC10B2]